MATLPRPDVQVTPTGEKTNVTISRDGKSRTYSSQSNHGTTEAIREVVEQIINDPLTIEVLP